MLTNGKADFTSEQSDDLKRHNIAVIGTEIAAIVHRDGYLEKVNLMDGNSISLTALYAAIPFFQHSDIAASLGCELTTPGHVKVDLFQKTTIPDVFACGDNSSMIRSVANAIATGNIVGAMINRELTMEQF